MSPRPLPCPWPGDNLPLRLVTGWNSKILSPSCIPQVHTPLCRCCSYCCCDSTPWLTLSKDFNLNFSTVVISHLQTLPVWHIISSGCWWAGEKSTWLRWECPARPANKAASLLLAAVLMWLADTEYFGQLEELLRAQSSECFPSFRWHFQLQHPVPAASGLAAFPCDG